MNTATLTCPACQAPKAQSETACSTCGLLFASYAPQAAPVAAPVSQAPQLVYAPLLPGQPLANGRFTVQRPLSKGGMGAIYLAIDHEAFDRMVVIKTMLDYFDPTDPKEVLAARERFLHEAKTLATLKHPAIPQIFTYFRDGPHNYIVMEYIEGHDLEQRLTRLDDRTGLALAGQPYHYLDVVRWGVELCRILEYLASRQPHPVVHHDIKPANVLLDQHSNTIRLVDFGTAKARLLLQTGGRVGMQRSSIYGTNGYAPPEQYRGQSEPRSDVYALAATLYHLATDDDPRAHPFDFPRLNQLGALGQVLSAALEDDVTKRPTAGALRRQLEALLAPVAIRPIQTPDGTNVGDEHELAAWCARNWPRARTWLYKDRLLEQIERLWGKGMLVTSLQQAIASHGDDLDAGLDAALALLDPLGYGACPPQISAGVSVLDFGTHSSYDRSERTLGLSNNGRYVRVQLQLPPWVQSAPTLALPPGQTVAVPFVAHLRHLPIGNAQHATVLLTDGPNTLLQVHVQAHVSHWRTLARRYSSELISIVSVVAAVMIVAAMVLLGRDLHARREATKAYRYELVRRSIQARQWDAAAAAIVELSALDPGYRDLEELIAAHPELGRSLAVRRAAAWQSGKPHVVASLSGHFYPINSLAFSPDGQLVASSSDDRTIKVWQVSERKLLHEFSLLNEVRDIAFSPDGQYLAAAGGRDQVFIWHVNTRSMVLHLDGHTSAVTSIAFSPDGRLLVSGGVDNVVKIWRTRDGALARTLKGHRAAVMSVAFCPDNQTIASADSEGTIKLWHARDGALLRTLTGHTTWVEAVAFSPDGQLLASGGEDRTVRIWRVRDGTPLHTLTGHTDKIMDVTWSVDGQVIASSSGDKDTTIRLWRVSDGAELQKFTEKRGAVQAIAFSPDGRFLASKGGSHTLKLWSVQE